MASCCFLGARILECHFEPSFCIQKGSLGASVSTDGVQDSGIPVPQHIIVDRENLPQGQTDPGAWLDALATLLRRSCVSSTLVKHVL